MTPRRLSIAVVFWLAGRILAAQIAAEERIPVTDPDRLVKLGFRPDATNVYVWSKAHLEGVRLDERAATATETWGTRSGYSNVLGPELQPGYPLMYLNHYLDLGTFCYGDVPNSWAWAQFQVPDGAKLGFLSFWVYDLADPEDLVFDVFETCQLPGIGPPINTLIGHSQSFLAIGHYAGFTPIDDLAVDNRDCTYTVRVQFAACLGVSLAVHKLQLNWVRQVSPAPAMATFDDVPTNHPFFQFIEALSKSGTTAGCETDPPLYCPDRPITRGEMAVYLAKALGLQWP